MIEQKDITIGIITAGSNFEKQRNLDDVIEKASTNISQAKIILVGGEKSYSEYLNVSHIKFDESQRSKWITRKKNIIVNNCKTEILVLCHDYIEFAPDWFDKWNEFGWDWDYAVNVVNTVDGQRDSDLNSFCHPLVPAWHKMPLELCTEENFPYTYVSGGYWLAKTEFMKKVPLNENLCWGQGEDLEWCLRARQIGKFKYNKNCIVKHNVKR